MFELRWLQVPETTTATPKLQYRTWDTGAWTEWADVPLVIAERRGSPAPGDAQEVDCGGCAPPLIAAPPSAPVGVGAIRRARAIIDHVTHGEPGYELSEAHDLLTAALAQQTAAVDWRAQFIDQAAAYLRAAGMKIEQARIHAETAARRVEIHAQAAQQEHSNA